MILDKPSATQVKSRADILLAQARATRAQLERDAAASSARLDALLVAADASSAELAGYMKAVAAPDNVPL